MLTLLRQSISSRAALHGLAFHLTGRLLSAALASLLLCLSSAHAQPLLVAVVLSESGGAYQEFSAALQGDLSERYVLQIARAGEPIQDADLVVAVGMKAASAASNFSQPILNVFVPRAGFEKLSRAASPVFSAIYMDQPLERQLALISSIFPRNPNIGVLYATPPAELEELRRLSAARHFTLHERTVDQKHPVASALSDLLEESEVLLVLPDATIYNSDTIRNILLETYRKQVPMVGLSPGYVRAGALCAVYSTPEQIAKQAADAIEQFAISGKLPASQYPGEFDVSVNTQVARSLGLVIKDAERLRAEIRRRQ